MLVFNSFRLDVANASLSRGKQAISLTPKAFNVLRYLLEHAGQLVSKDDLWRAVWPGISVTDATLTNCVSEIRKALGDDSKAPRYIETLHRLGYRFIAPVSTESARIGGSRVIRQDSPPPPLRSPTPHFVGRKAESAQLYEWLGRALQGERQIVFVTGEPGIGKTTLVEEFLRQEQVTAGESLWIGRGQCIEHYGAGEAYLPLLDALGRLCHEPGGGQLLELLDKHAPAWLVQMPGLLDAAELKELQGRVAGVTRERMLRELADATEVISQERPLVLRLEDLHWSDHSTLDWLGFLARRQEPARVLVVGTYRPVEVIVRDHPLKILKNELQIHGQCKELPLALLSEAAVVEYLNLRLAFSNSGIEHSAECHPQEPVWKLARAIYQRTDGNPLFMVNVVDYLLGRQALQTCNDRVSAQPAEAIVPQSIDTPPSLVQMIEHNMDRLNPDEQAVLEAASVTGEEFSAAAVAAALGRSVGESEASCAQLSRRQQFLRMLDTSEWPDGTLASTFRFQHSLYGEVLYKRLPARHRVELHRRLAERLDIAWGERAEEIASELAYHYTEAGCTELAIRYWEIAAKKARKGSANVEAIAQLRKAIQLAATLPVSADSLIKRARLQVALISPLIASQGYTSFDVERACNQALELAENMPDSVQLFGVLGTLCSVYIDRGQLRMAMELTQRMVRVAEHSDRPSCLLWAHYSMGFIFLEKGDYLHARDHFEICLRLYDSKQQGSYGFVQDPGPTALIALALAVHSLGYPDLALQRTTEALALARQISQPFTLAWVLVYGGEIFMRRGDQCNARALWEEGIALCSKHDLNALLGDAIARLGWALVECGCTEEGIAHLREGVEKSKVRMDAAVGRGRLALALGRNGQLDEALRLIQETVTQEAEGEMGMRLTLLHQIKGDLLLMHGSANQAEVCFRQAIDIARSQHARAQELTAATRLARLLAQQDRRDEARTMLGNVYGWFTEGFNTGDLKEAKLLLDELQ